MSSSLLSVTAIESFEKKNGGKAASRILKALARTEPFHVAINSDIGQELLKDCVVRMDQIIEMIIDESAEEKDRAEFRALKSITASWSTRIHNYLENVGKISK